MGPLIVAAVAVALGCGSKSDSESTSGPDPTSAGSTAGEAGTSESGGSEAEGGPSSGNESSEEAGSSGDDPKLDVGSPDGGMGCSKVDFLFVIDNSVSMHEKQESLVNSFPGFIDVIENTVAADDFHILVTDTDPHTRCTETACADQNNGFAQCLCPGEDNGWGCSVEYSECDMTRGAGVVRPIGRNASNKECAIEGGNRYLTSDQPDLTDTFACMAKVGEAGKGIEKPMDSMIAALSDDINGPGGCNEGFLRDDAILVITFISDDPNYEDTDGPQEWVQAVVDAKGGNAEAVVVLGLVPEYNVCEIEQIPVCLIIGFPKNNPNTGKHWMEFVESFGERGMWAHVCESDYSPFFEQAVSVISETCDNFDPEG